MNLKLRNNYPLIKPAVTRRYKKFNTIIIYFN